METAVDTEDWVYSLHRDFNHRTRGKTSASLQSTVGAYHVDTALCVQTLQQNHWAEHTRKRMLLLREGQADVDRALAVEWTRRRMVRELMARISDILKVHGSKERRVPQHQIVEMLTGWILHERNDPEQERMLYKLAFCDESQGNPSESASSLLTPDTLYKHLYPVLLQRSFVLPADVGSEVVVNATGARGTLVSLVNAWRGVVSLTGDESSMHREEELADLRLLTAVPQGLDVLIPSPDLHQRGSSTAVFIRMQKWCASRDAANVASRQVTDAVKQVRQQFLALAHNPSVAVSMNSAAISFSVESADIGGEEIEVVELRCGALRCPMLRRAWDKMRALYDANNAPGNSTDSADDVTRVFAARLLTVLLRYASLSGASVQNVDQTAGFHAAVPPIVYAKLREVMGTVVEGFASPMNSTSTHFCSLFPDCDSFFGSLGSFFHLSMAQHFPRGISMSCNPPYSVIVMLRVADQLTKLFADAEVLKVPLEVFVVVCNWDVGEDNANADKGGSSGRRILTQLREHEFCAKHRSLPPSSAPFQDGHAFVLNRPFFTLASNTEVFFFQNTFANEKWPEHRAKRFEEVVTLWTSLSVRESVVAAATDASQDTAATKPPARMPTQISRATEATRQLPPKRKRECDDHDAQ